MNYDPDNETAHEGQCEELKRFVDFKPVAVVVELEAGHDGPGWYWYEDECRDEGVCGSFRNRAEAVHHASTGGYTVEGMTCDVCTKPLTIERAYFDTVSGKVECQTCAGIELNA